MKIVYSLTLLAIFLTTASTASAQKNVASKKQIPLIDRALFFDNPEITGGQLSPDGKYISFLKAYNGILNIWVKKFDAPFDQATRLTDLERPAAGYFWTYDSRYIVYAKDKGGNENYNVFAVNPAAAVEKGGVPESRNLTPNDSVAVVIYMVSKKNPDVMVIGMNDRSREWHDLYKLEISSGKLTRLKENDQRISGWVFDWEENPRLAVKNPSDGSTELLRIEGDSMVKIYECGPLEAVIPLKFTKDNKEIYLVSNKGADVDLQKLVLMNPNNGQVRNVESDPDNEVDIESVWFSDNTREIVSTSYFGEKLRRYFKDKGWEADYKLLQTKFPRKEIGFGSRTQDEMKVLVTVSSDRSPGDSYFFDRRTKQLIHQYTPRPKLKQYENDLSVMKPISYKSSDGLSVPAYLTLPAGVPPSNLPLIVVPHGGPWYRDYWGYDPWAQWLANRGFAVLQPNFRGSTGYGKKFIDAGNMQWGKLMQDDITWGVKNLIAEGIADPKRVAIFGASYGGYATLAGLAFTPAVYTCGVDYVGPSNLFTLLSTIPPYWAAFRMIFTLRMGDEATEEGKKILREASPLFSAEKIKAPLLIIQGANDPRVNKAESDQIVSVLRDQGKVVSYILADDEGHGFYKPVNEMAALAATEKFLGEHCGTRYQKEMPQEVAQRLKEMTVDIKTVEAGTSPDGKDK